GAEDGARLLSQDLRRTAGAEGGRAKRLPGNGEGGEAARDCPDRLEGSGDPEGAAPDRGPAGARAQLLLEEAAPLLVEDPLESGPLVDGEAGIDARLPRGA